MTEGVLTLGTRLLPQRRAVQRPTTTSPPEARPRYVAKYKQLALDPERVTQPLAFEYMFDELPEDVHLSGEGLGQLYVSFGAPGTGKSYLLKRLLQQLADPSWKTPWGGLLLDPKLTLIGDVRDVIPPERLRVIGPCSGGVNLLASHLQPRDLGVALALAAQATGISGHSAYWINELKRLLGAGLALLAMLGEPVSLARLAELMLGAVAVDGRRVTRLQVAAERANRIELSLDDARRRDGILATLNQFTAAKGENVDTVRSFLSQILAPFMDPDLDYVSDVRGNASLSDLIFGEGRWVLLDVPRSALAVSRFLSTLAKVLFQRAALERWTLYPGNDRRVFLFIDEYAEVATDIPGEGFGDSIFFSQMRQFRVLSFVATQGIPMLENSGVRETWKTIITNSAGKLFFRVADPDTADLATRLLGESDLVVSDGGLTESNDGASLQLGRKLEKRTLLTSDLFLAGLQRGQLALVGNTDGHGRATVQIVKVR